MENYKGLGYGYDFKHKWLNKSYTIKGLGKIVNSDE